MTKSTVTTEQLRERLEIFAREHKDGETPEKREIAGFYASAFTELLAVREAQSVPVAHRYRYNGKHLASAGCGDMVSSWKYCEESDLVNPDERYEHQALFTVPPAPAVPDDTRRMDWLVAHCVEVRKPLLYGSEKFFTAQTLTDEEDDYHATSLREQIDAALAAAPTPTK